MGRLTERLASSTAIGLDTSVFIYHLEAHPAYLSITQEIFTGIEAGKWAGITSMITLMEVTIQPWRLERPDVARKYEVLLVNFPNLRILPIDRDIARRAAELRAKFAVCLADALQVAASMIGGAKAFITNDRQLLRLQPVLDIVILGDFLS